MEQRRRGRPARLTLDDVVLAAVALADAEGLDAVTMRAVATRLGVGAMSLYTHVPDKESLVDAMLERVSGEPDLPAQPSGDWRADLRVLAREQRALLQRHHWVIEAVSHRRPLGPNGLAALEFALGALEPTRLTPAERMEVFALLTGFVINVARAELADRATDGDPARAARAQEQIAATLATGRFPRSVAAFAAIAAAHSTPARPQVADRFDALLDRMLDGLVGPAG